MTSQEDDYVQREELLASAWANGSQGSASPGALFVDDLIAAMKEKSKVHGYLSSLYFAGADVDHPYFLKSDNLAVGLAVLPEDVEKAGRRKRHPHQVEVIFVLRGSLHVHYEEAGEIKDAVLREGDHHVIPKNTCHWITPDIHAAAAYLFVKTNPAKEPRSKSCSGQ